jgi:predicted phosphodiesterase
VRLLVCGDWHGNLAHARGMVELARLRRCALVVQLGDFGWWPHQRPHELFAADLEDVCESRGVGVYWIDGNHENFDDLARRPRRVAEDGFSWCYQRPGSETYLERIRYVPRGTTWRWGGRRFLAFGGGYSVDRPVRRAGFSWWPQEVPSDEQVEGALARAHALAPVDVMLTHDAPVDDIRALIGIDFDVPESRRSRRAIARLVDAYCPRLLLHGHYHLARHYRHRRADGGETDVWALAADGALRGGWAVRETDALAVLE